MKAHFGSKPLPRNLIALIHFIEGISEEDQYDALYLESYISNGFMLQIEDDQTLINHALGYNKVFDNSFIEFARADGTGSSYSIWLKNPDIDIENAPIVVFGSEGGQHVVAKNFDTFLLLISNDVDPSIGNEKVSYFTSEEFYNPSKKIAVFRRWLLIRFSLKTLPAAADIVAEAQTLHQEDLEKYSQKHAINGKEEK